MLSFSYLGLFRFFKDFSQIVESSVFAILQNMMENGVFEGQLQFWNLFLFGLSQSDIIRQNVLFFNLEVDFLVV